MKLKDWWPKLIEYTQQNKTRAREYGAWDCWQYTAGGVLVMTGIDYRERFPQYASLEEGIRILASHGGAEQMMTELFGPPKPVAFAKRGDIVISDLGEGPAGGICHGIDTWTVSPAGLETVPTLSGIAAWSVG